MREINWEEIQKFYDNGKTYKDIRNAFGLSFATIAKAVKKGLLKTRSMSEARKLADLKRGHSIKHSEETKKKISIARKQYLKDNPDKVPYLLNHYSKGNSYPEKYFEECFRNSSIVKKYRILNYELDFADIENKIDIEIDGNQHFYDEKIIAHDINRNKVLSELGWKIFRVKWAEFQRLDKVSRTQVVDSLISYSDPNVDCILFIDENPNEEKIKKYQAILKEKSKPKRTKEYLKPKQRKVKRPPYKQLLQEIKESSFLAVGRKYGVSDNSIRKWIKIYEKYGE